MADPRTRTLTACKNQGYFKKSLKLIQCWSGLFSDVVAPKGAVLFIALKRAVLSVRMPGLPAELPKAQPSVSVRCTLCIARPSSFPAKTMLPH